MAALRRLYGSGSALAAQDVSVLRRYGERGLRVTGLQQQVVSLEVHAAGAGAMTLEVVERLARAGVRPTTGPGTATGSVSLPASRFARRLLRFERVDGAWRLSWARAA